MPELDSAVRPRKWDPRLRRPRIPSPPRRSDRLISRRPRDCYERQEPRRMPGLSIRTILSPLPLGHTTEAFQHRGKDGPNLVSPIWISPLDCTTIVAALHLENSIICSAHLVCFAIKPYMPPYSIVAPSSKRIASHHRTYGRNHRSSY